MSIDSTKLFLRGPAGLFKKKEKHPLCWGFLNKCNTNISTCPIDVLTFHRKGKVSYADILTETKELISNIFNDYTNLRELPYANTEADPTSGWSKNVTAYANVHYAVSIINIVFDHWNALYKGDLNNLISISHDNAFLSYHPYNFEQRTLLARFQMNNTEPPSLNFIQKPVFAALGLLSSLGRSAAGVQMSNSKNVSYLTTVGQNYAAILLTSNPANDFAQEEHYKFKIDLKKVSKSLSMENTTYAYLVEYLQTNLTDPFYVWNSYGRPAYPNVTVMTEMTMAQVINLF